MRGRLFLGFCFVLLSAAAFANASSATTEPAPVAVNNKNYQGKEILFRLSPKFGFLGKMRQNYLDSAIKRFIFENGEAGLEFQFAEHWFGSFTFHYSHLRGKSFQGFVGDGHIYAPTGGVKIVSSTKFPSTGEFFDDTRWWFGMEFGPYFTTLNTRLPDDQNGTNLGFNTGAGFDYFFASRFAAGLQMKLHYVKFDQDDYFLFTFGPHLVVRIK